MNKKVKVLVLGGGAGGISVAARLASLLPQGSIAIVDPAKYHFYQPMWTLVGGGVNKKEDSRRLQSTIIPDGVEWIKDSVVKINPKENSVQLSHQGVVEYETLVVATGLVLNWGSIAGLDGNLGHNGIHTIYEYEQAEKTWNAIRGFKGGQAIFVMPAPPIKCAGAPQKIMYMAEETFRNNGVREKSEVIYTTPGKAMFGVPVFAQALAKVVERKKIQTRYLHKLVAVKASEKIAVFDKVIEENKDGQMTTRTEKVEIPYELLHVVPTMKAHDFISESGLAFVEGDQKGWLKVDKQSLQHLDYPNIFGVGDVTGVPNSKTAAAVRKQAPVVVRNLILQLQKKALTEKYDGYSSCPLITSYGTVMLAEFGYDGKLMPTFPLDPTKERWSMWILKKCLLPILYWYGMLKGRA